MKNLAGTAAKKPQQIRGMKSIYCRQVYATFPKMRITGRWSLGDSSWLPFFGMNQSMEEGIYSIVSIPLTIKARVIGVLPLYTAEPRKSSAQEIAFLESLAEMGALAIKNARMYEQVRKD